MTEWKEITMPPIVKLEKEGEAIEGVFKGIRQGQYGNLYDIEVAPNEIKTLGSDTVLNTKLTMNLIGKTVKIEYFGLKTSTERKGAKYKDYKIFVAEDK